MSTQNEQLKHISEIRELMEKSSRFLSLSGLSGIFAGIFALMGSFAAYWYFDFNLKFLMLREKIYTAEGLLRMDFLVFVFSVAGAVLLLSVLFALFFSLKKAKKKDYRFWDKNALRVLINMMIPLATGGILVLIMLYHNHVAYLAGLTLIFYGLALVNTSKYTYDDIRLFGLLEICLGLLACIFVGYGLLFWAVGFGLLHIIYGILLYFRYER